MDECELVYRYLPILADQDMRVLKLEPALHYNDPLVASLFSRPIQDDTESPSPTYQCISYCWGIFEKSGWLICDNQRLSITANVDAILRHLRKASKPRNLWIDTLCINQADDWEKANQVRSMGRIYKRADKVHIWLGTANDKDCIPSVFAVFREQVNTVEQLILTYESTFGHISPQMVAALLSFFDRPWFNRRWVLQEVVLAHSATVHCGHHTLSWNWVREAVAKLHSGYLQRHPAQNNPSFPSSVVNAFENVALLEARRVDEISILQLLWNHHASECADARDRLFALYAMVPATLRNALNPHEHCPVNYTENFALLYTKLAAAAINTGFGLTILNHALAFGSLEQQDPHWPSWVPSWNRSRDSRAPEAFGGFQRSLHASVTWIEDFAKLQLRGKLRKIMATQQSSVTQGAINFFKSNSPYPRSSRKLYGAMVISILTRCIDDPRSDFDFDAVFGEIGGFPPHAGRIICLQRALKRELGLQSPSEEDLDHVYNHHHFCEEVDKVLQYYSVFLYNLKGMEVPGLAFTKVHAGDYVFKPKDLSSRDPLTLGLVIRPYSRSANDTHDLFLGCCRLVGACVHSDYYSEDLETFSMRKMLRKYFNSHDESDKDELVDVI